MDFAAIATVTAAAGTWLRIRWVRRQRLRERLNARMAGTEFDFPLDTGHLSPELARLAEATRILRLSLATPLVRFVEGIVHESPWRRRERCNEYDLVLADLRRAVWDWLRLFDGLSQADRTLVTHLGFSPRTLWRLLFAPGVLERTDDVFEEVIFPARPDLEGVSAVLGGVVLELREFEVALLATRPDPYR